MRNGVDGDLYRQWQRSTPSGFIEIGFAIQVWKTHLATIRFEARAPPKVISTVSFLLPPCEGLIAFRTVESTTRCSCAWRGGHGHTRHSTLLRQFLFQSLMQTCNDGAVGVLALGDFVQVALQLPRKIQLHETEEPFQLRDSFLL